MYHNLGPGLEIDLDPPSPTGVDIMFSHEDVAERLRDKLMRESRTRAEVANLYRYVGNNPANFVDPSGLLRRWQSIRGVLGFVAGVGLVSFGLVAVSPLVGVAAIAVGATGVVLGSVNVIRGVKDTGPKNTPGTLTGLAGQCLDRSVRPYRDPEIAGAFQITGDIVGFGVNQVPKVVFLSKEIPKMIST